MGNRLLNNVGTSCLQTPTTTQQFEWHLHDSHGQTLLLWVQGTLHVCCHTVQFNQLCDKRVKHCVATICRVVSTCEDRGFSLGKPIKEMSWGIGKCHGEFVRQFPGISVPQNQGCLREAHIQNLFN